MNRTKSLVEWVAFQAVWLVCAIGASRGYSAPGVIAAVAFSFGVLAQRRWERGEVLIVVASGVVGAIAETFLIAVGLVRFAAPWPSAQAAPVWIVALWVAFGATLPTMASLFGSRFAWKAFGAGLVGGPLAYWAGARIGALEVIGYFAQFYVVAALIWAAALPSLLMLRARLLKA